MGLVWISKESNHNHCQVCDVFGATFMASFSQLLIEYLTLTLLHMLRAIIFHYVNNIIAIYQFFMFLFFPVVKKKRFTSE